MLLTLGGREFCVGICEVRSSISDSIDRLLVGVEARIPFILSYEKHQNARGGP